MAEIEDGETYIVQLSRPINIGHTWLRPSNRCVMRGAEIKRLQNDPKNSDAISVVQRTA